MISVMVIAAGTLERLIASRTIAEGDVRGGSCIEPACLEASLAQSLAAMHLQTVRDQRLYSKEVAWLYRLLSWVNEGNEIGYIYRVGYLNIFHIMIIAFITSS